MNKQKVTCWMRFYPKQQVYKYNHYSDGWVPVEQAKPTEFDTFKDYTWAKQYQHKIDHQIQ